MMHCFRRRNFFRFYQTMKRKEQRQSPKARALGSSTPKSRAMHSLSPTPRRRTSWNRVEFHEEIRRAINQKQTVSKASSIEFLTVQCQCDVDMMWVSYI